jgi:hypothetical protein
MCCIMYLCQRHHDPEILDEEIADNILSGAYRLHEFATTMWLELTERVASSSQSQVMLAELASLLQTLICERKNDRYNDASKKTSPRSLETFEKPWFELHDILCKAVHFRQICLKSDYQKTQGESSLRNSLILSFG